MSRLLPLTALSKELLDANINLDSKNSSPPKRDDGYQKRKRPRLIESWDARRTALPQELLAFSLIVPMARGELVFVTSTIPFKNYDFTKKYDSIISRIRAWPLGYEVPREMEVPCKLREKRQ